MEHIEALKCGLSAAFSMAWDARVFIAIESISFIGGVSTASSFLNPQSICISNSLTGSVPISPVN